MTIRIGLFGTSWWSDSMYMPALRANSAVEVVAVCGRDPGRCEAFARLWEIPDWFVNPTEMFDQPLDAVVIATTNDTHAPLSLLAIDLGLHVLCEKPLGTTVDQARSMATAAAARDLTTMVPFTYRYMPTNRWVKELIDEGFIGRPHHLGLRYFAGYGRTPEYSWRFDNDVAGSGVLGDLGSHWIDMASWMFGEITEIGATTESMIERDNRPDGEPYDQGEDSAVITARFAGGANAVLQVSSVCWEGENFGQTHHLDAHGSEGTLYSQNDWHTVQEVRGLAAGQPGPAQIMEIPDRIWNGIRRASVHDTYRDVFRDSQCMIGEFIDAATQGRKCHPDFETGAKVQQLLSLAARSATDGGALLPVSK